MSMKKAYRAVSGTECEEMWLGESASIPEGWYDGAPEALKAYRGVQSNEESRRVEKPKRRRGRPRKSEQA